MKERPTAESKCTAEAIVLPQRLIDVYSLLASLARQRRAAALKELDMPPEPAS